MEDITSFTTTVGGYHSVRLSTIWAEVSSKFDNHYVPWLIDSSNRIKIFLPDNEIPIKYPYFNRHNECKVTGHYRIDKRAGRADKEVTKLAIWNVISEVGNKESAYILIESTIIDNQKVESREVELFDDALKKDIVDVRWVDCKYHKVDELYCFVNLEVVNHDAGEQKDKFKSILVKRIVEKTEGSKDDKISRIYAE